MSQVYSLIILCVSLRFSESAQNSALRIIGGRDATPGEHPYAVRLEHHYKYQIFLGNKTKTKVFGVCSGSALTPTWILTARHCCRLDNFNYTKNKKKYIEEYKFLIRYGSPHLKPSENSKLAAVLKTKRPRMRSPRTNDDIALMNTEPVSVEVYAKISAIDYTSLYGHEVTCMGFGEMRASSDKNDFNSTYDLDKPLQIMDKSMLRSCDDGKKDIKLCAVPECGKDQTVYFGDSGAPVVHTSGVIGVNCAISHTYVKEVSKSWKRNTKPIILIVTPVSLYLDWINSHVTRKNDPT